MSLNLDRFIEAAEMIDGTHPYGARACYACDALRRAMAINTTGRWPHQWRCYTGEFERVLGDRGFAGDDYWGFFGIPSNPENQKARVFALLLVREFLLSERRTRRRRRRKLPGK